MSKRKFYAVVRGREPGIYDEWFGQGGAEAQIKGIQGAVYKGFATQAEAEAWYTERAGHAPALRLTAGQPAAPPPRLSPDPDEALLAGKVVVFTDGACEGNPGPGGYAAVLRYGEQRKELAGGFARTTNNRMELQAPIAALRTLKGRRAVLIYSDSSYVVNGFQKGWVQRWSANGWQREEGGRSAPLKNADLWRALLELVQRHEVTFVQVPGHAGVPDNERCDQLAVAASRRCDLPPDSGFEE
jgi:ribonuclease HI